MFTKKQLIIAIVLAIIFVTVISILELSTTFGTFMILVFAGLGIYFIYQNNKGKSTKRPKK
ncbi:hypothetical protein SAMN04488100_11439 [Alkalibacterium putridalgicola]|uniref:Uncharacterized protein n=1 Tax=Alkalibacterium putridalgicola TaxID=426703 RepID=A0A1H7TVU4_9LACT|nr:hypothetical protein APU01nite_06340 [Alkalibacterium putridalgicola]SEL88773.1 hypothetical protein SAMN04488100_11439 [Alkalibacterium putridalgicola]